MLEVGIDDRDIGRGAGQHALDTGARQATAAHPAQAAHARIKVADLLDGRGGAVGRIVVDKDRFPGDPGQAGVQTPHQFGDIAPLLEGLCRQGVSMDRVINV
jgi:hypothetical protein